MTKYEFLGDLSRLIADLPEEDQEQAMEYYEDYFADAGPEKESEIIKDFVSPEFIAQQVRESATQRMTLAQEQVASTNKDTLQKQNIGSTKKPIFARKSAAQALRNAGQLPPESNQKTETINTGNGQTATPTVSPIQPSNSAGNGQTAAPIVPPIPIKNASTSASSSQQDNSMRNPIFQNNAHKNTESEEDMAAARKKTKLDIKAIDKSTSNASKKQRSSKKEMTEDTSEFSYANNLYSGPKRILVILLLLITCPITLSILAVIIGIFAVVLGIILFVIVASIGLLISSILFLLLGLLSFLTIHIANGFFALGAALLLFALSWIICLFDRYLLSRLLPSAYHRLVIQIKNIRAKLKQFALKH